MQSKTTEGIRVRALLIHFVGLAELFTAGQQHLIHYIYSVSLFHGVNCTYHVIAVVFRMMRKCCLIADSWISELKYSTLPYTFPKILLPVNVSGKGKFFIRLLSFYV